MAPAPAKPTQKENRRLDSILAFTTRLEKALRDASDTGASLADSLFDHIESIALVPTTASVNKARDLDERGTRLWNLASKIKDGTKSAQMLAQGPRPFHGLSAARTSVTAVPSQNPPRAPFTPNPGLTAAQMIFES
ncbi:MAG: hypothetical protein Q9169_000265 [Polycauliona sp. 2 TL-2023]